MIYTLRAVSCLRNPARTKYIAALLQKRFVKLDPIPALSTEATETFEEKNARLQRPLSPHLTIYKMPFPAVLSISHRITGVMLVGYFLTFGIACRLYTVSDIISMINSLGLSPSTWTACKAVVVYPYFYHLVNGLRHLVWDFGLGLSLKSVYKTGYVVIALSILGSCGIAAYFK